MSCCSCLKIQVLSAVTGMPDRFKNNDRLYLDLTADSTLELSKALSKLSILDTIEDEAAIEITIDYTPKNDLIAKFVRNHNLTGNDYAPLPILVQEGSVTHHTFAELQFTGASDATKSYSAKVQRGSGHWLRGAKEKYLNTINFGNFEFNQANLQDNWENDEEYNDGDTGVYFPLAHYGGWFSKTTILVEDFRPYFHALSVLQKGFCETGWTFRCPWLETKTGRQLGSYILDDALGMDETVLEGSRFYASKGTTAGTGNRVEFPDITLNNGGYYNPATGSFTALGIFNFTCVIDIEMQVGSTPGSFTISIVKTDATESQFEILASFSGTSQTGTTIQATIDAKNIAVSPGEYIQVRFTEVTDCVVLARIGYFKNDPVRIPPKKGDIVDLGSLIDPDYTLLDFLKGITHAANGRFKTDWINKTLWLYTPYDAEWFLEDIDGFYTNTIEDVTELIVPESEEIRVERTGQARYVNLQYKGSSDAYISDKDLEIDLPLYTKEVDLGSGFIETTQDIANPFFEATANAIIDKFVSIAPATNVKNVDIPHLWDNTNGEVSYKIAPRLIYFFGYVYQIEDSSGTDDLRRWKLEGSSRQQLPYAFQKANSKYSPVSIADGSYAGGIEITDIYAAYGGVGVNDFYNLGYARELLTRKFTNRSGFQMLINAARYRRTDFRGLYKVFYNGRTFLFRLEEINAYQTCSDYPAQVVIRPEPYAGDLCADSISVNPDTCHNQPRIEITVNVSGDYISADADDSAIYSTIDTDDWEYSIDAGLNFVSYTPDDQITGYDSVVFRREVSFSDGCPTKVVTRTGSFDSACENNPGISLNYTDGTNTITASGTGSFNSTVATDVFEVSVDGGSYISYTEGDPVNGFDTVTFRRTTNYTNSCPETVVTATYTVEGETCDNNPEIAFVQIGNSKAYTLSIDETNVNSDIAAVVFQISDNDGATWHMHMGQLIPRYPTTIVRAFVYYADGCPMSLIEVICP